jgi:ABC-type lipoprotein export system ATPase subunit
MLFGVGIEEVEQLRQPAEIDLTVLMGPSGSGKTTLLSILWRGDGDSGVRFEQQYGRVPTTSRHSPTRASLR